jgi:S-adenosyl methyltransferase
VIERGDWLQAASAEELAELPDFDTTRAHIARVQDYWLGGKDHFEVDRVAGREAINAFPEIVESVRNTRAFLGRTIRFLAAEVGIRQFLDIGTGIPTAANTHEVAQEVAPESRIAYVDNDSMVLAHARALLTSDPRGSCAYIDASIQDTGRILGQAANVLDFTRPVAVVLMAVLHLVPDTDDPHAIVRTLMNAVPAGSYLVISHPASDIKGLQMARMASRLNELMAQRVTPRSREQVMTFFDGLELVEPGLIRCPEWHPVRPEDATATSTMWGGVARKPG